MNEENTLFCIAGEILNLVNQIESQADGWDIRDSNSLYYINICKLTKRIHQLGLILLDNSGKKQKTNETEWLERVKEEKEELCKKIEKLKSFLNAAPTNPNVKPYGMLLLRDQLLAMYRYRDVLERRIKYEENNK